MKITRKSMATGKTRVRDIDVTEDQLKRWRAGEAAQTVFSHLNADDREFIMTGIVSEEWDASFGDDEDENDS